MNKKDLEGAVNVNGDITPFGREKVPKINAAKWQKQNLSQLFDQLEDLRNRYYLAQSARISPNVLAQLQQGIARLEQIIRSKDEDEIKVIGNDFII